MDRTKSRSDSLTRRTTDTLRQMIVDGVLNLGQPLSESKVGRLLGVSRTPVREAFAHLEIEGLVFAEPQRGTRVFLLGPRDVDDICDVRCSLEKTALALAMKGDRRELFSLLSDATTRMTSAIQTGDISVYLRLDRQFHQAVFDCADNVFLNDAYQTIANKMAALRTRLATRPDYLRKGHGEHLRLCELVRAGDEDGALAVLEEHVSRKEDSFWHLNDGLAETDAWRSRTELRAAELAANPTTQFGRDERRPDATSSPANRHESHSQSRVVDKKCVDVIQRPEFPKKVIRSADDGNKRDANRNSKKDVDEKRRGRPRLHADNAARKRAWAARARAKKKAEAATSGQTKKRGRPRKHAIAADRQGAHE